MNSIRWRRMIAPLFLSLVLLITACKPTQQSRYADVQKETSQRGVTAVAKKAEQGATFNKFFPDGVRGYDIIAAQEKKGFAEYKVNKDGKTVAMLSISDTTSVPSAAAKYQAATDKVAGYPAVDQGMMGTGILVNDRYQVKVLSRDASFTKDDRVLWLQKFDLKGLAKLKPAIAPTTATKELPKPTFKMPQSPVLTPQPAAMAPVETVKSAVAASPAPVETAAPPSTLATMAASVVQAAVVPAPVELAESVAEVPPALEATSSPAPIAQVTDVIESVKAAIAPEQAADSAPSLTLQPAS
jgi:hypothetical protein